MARYIDADKLIAECDRVHIGPAGRARKLMVDAPTADVEEVKHGGWICLESEIGFYCCSLCEHKILRAKCNYCPNCGAKMDGGKTT